ncbi:MAG: hypothetical protein HZC37_14810 [Burkholderiales bacterium]|nr:hypothetical protein [Burkholderiales bacterium]
MNALRLMLRLAWWTLLLLLAALALLIAAWLPFNLQDVAPKTRPAELQLPAARVPDERNAAYAVAGLLAEAGRDPAAAGRTVWAAHRSWSALPPAQRAPAAAGRDAGVNAAMGKTLSAPKGAPLNCDGQRATCDADWLAAGDALARQRAGYGAIGERCDKLIEGAFEFEELLPPGRGVDAPIMPWTPAVDCSRWFRSGAMAALARGRREEALVQLRRADRLHRELWDGARTLIGHMVATRLARNTYNSMAAAAIRDPALAEAMAPWLSAPLDTRAGARRWMVHEANFQRGLVDEVGPSVGAALAMSESPLAPLGTGPGAEVVAWLGSRGIGFHAERTRQRIDEAWMRRIGTLEYVWPAVLAGVQVEQQARRQLGPAGRVKWRNTFGEAVIEASEGALGGYLARHADHELHREATALVLALQRQRVAPAQRAQAARKLPGVSDLLKERMSWSADGNALSVRAWQSEGFGYDPRRDAISFTWP